MLFSGNGKFIGINFDLAVLKICSVISEIRNTSSALNPSLLPFPPNRTELVKTMPPAVFTNAHKEYVERFKIFQKKMKYFAIISVLISAEMFKSADLLSFLQKTAGG